MKTFRVLYYTQSTYKIFLEANDSDEAEKLVLDSVNLYEDFDVHPTDGEHYIVDCTEIGGDGEEVEEEWEWEDEED